MYNMNMVVTYTITKIRLLTRKCRESNLNMCFIITEKKKKKKKKKRKNEVHRKKQIIKLANTKSFKSFCPHKHTFLKTNGQNVSHSFGVPNAFLASVLSKSQSGSKWG